MHDIDERIEIIRKQLKTAERMLQTYQLNIAILRFILNDLEQEKKQTESVIAEAMRIANGPPSPE